MMPVPMTSTRKKVAKPSTISMLENAVPGFAYARTAPHSAATSPAIDKWPKKLLSPSPVSGSSNMISVPITVRMISGKTRTYSTPMGGTKLTGTRGLQAMRHQPANGLYVLFQIHGALFEDSGVGRSDGGHEALRVSAHPDHEDEEWSH